VTSPVATGEVHRHVPEDLYASWSPSLSPDASQVAFISDRGGYPQIWLRTFDGGPLLCVPLEGRVTAVSWSPTGEWLACLLAAPGASRHEAWVVRPDGSDARLVAGAAPGTALLAQGRSRGWTADGTLLVTKTGHDTGASSEVLLIVPETGQRTVLHEGTLTVAIDASPDGQSLLVRRGPRGARDLLVVSGGAEQLVIAATCEGSSESGCLAPDGSTVYACTDVASELAQLVAGDLIVGHPGGELDEIALSGDGHVAALTWNVGAGMSALTLLDISTGRHTEVTPLPRHVVHGVGLSHDGRVLVLTAEGPADTKGVWWGPAGSRLAPLSSPARGTLHASRGASFSELDPDEVVPPQAHRLRSSDGTEIHGWLYRPPGVEALPTMVWLHGGPEAQERPVYSSLFQSLLADGVAVFAPNVRGSSGFGRSFRSADNGARRYGAFHDVAACASYLVDAGIAEPRRLGIMGRSYGGYLTLAALTRFPDLFQVGVDVCGMSDLHTWYATTEPWIAAAAVTKYGDPTRDRELLTDLSPMNRLDQLCAPLLLVHGSDDTNVPISESEQVAASLRSRGMPHELITFKGEGHELLATASRVAFVQATLHWVLEYL
jgi:dipeptidyl aminopeptidase/acylaminoacyl peptidase